MAEDIKRNNGFIPGVKPGKATADYLDTIMSRITWPGAFFLAIVAILPSFAAMFGVKAEFGQATTIVTLSPTHGMLSVQLKGNSPKFHPVLTSSPKSSISIRSSCGSLEPGDQ